MPTIFDHDPDLWEKHIFLYAEKSHLKVPPSPSVNPLLIS
jgi:hypothetical protein